MTGFGRATAELDGIPIAVEIKSVNNRFLKTSLRLPELLSAHEMAIEARVRETVQRGSVYVAVRYGGGRARSAFQINEERLRQYAATLKQLAGGLGLAPPVSIAELAQLSGAVEAEEPADEPDDAVLAAVLATLGAALTALNATRDAEGRALAADLRRHLESLLALNARVKERSPRIVEEYRTKLVARIAQLLEGTGTDPGEENIARECAWFADRCDVSEEIQRLDHHVRTAIELVGRDGEAGRRLDFLAQELLRETNTIGSKANDADLAGLVVEMKATIEKFKEQVQNVE